MDIENMLSPYAKCILDRISSFDCDDYIYILVFFSCCLNPWCVCVCFCSPVTRTNALSSKATHIYFGKKNRSALSLFLYFSEYFHLTSVYRLPFGVHLSGVNSKTRPRQFHNIPYKLYESTINRETKTEQK